MNGKRRVKERIFALETSSFRTENRIYPGLLNLVYLAIGAVAVWRLLRVFWLG